MVHTIGSSICPICSATIKWEYHEGNKYGTEPKVYLLKPKTNAKLVKGLYEHPLTIEVCCPHCSQLVVVPYTPDK